MSSDPYLDFKQEVDQTLALTRDLLTSYQRLVTTGSSSSGGAGTGTRRALVTEAHDELLASLEVLEGDIADLEDAVEALEEGQAGGQGWGIGRDEVRRRRGELDDVKREVQRIQEQAGTSSSSSSADPFSDPLTSRPGSSSRAQSATSTAFDDIPLAEAGVGRGSGRNSMDKPGKRYTDYNEDDDEERQRARDSRDLEEWERMEQRQLIREQDTVLHTLSGTLTNLAGMAGLIGSEVGEQNEMLDDLSTRVDATDNRLTAANKRLKQFVRQNEERASSWCILILIVVLAILLLVLIIT